MQGEVRAVDRDSACECGTVRFATLLAMADLDQRKIPLHYISHSSAKTASSVLRHVPRGPASSDDELSSGRMWV